MTNDLRRSVQALLRTLPTRKLDALKQLFWSELNYDRAGAALSMADWSAELRTLVTEAPQLFATAGEGDGFQVIYCRLSGVNQGRRSRCRSATNACWLANCCARIPTRCLSFPTAPRPTGTLSTSNTSGRRSVGAPRLSPHQHQPLRDRRAGATAAHRHGTAEPARRGAALAHAVRAVAAGDPEPPRRGLRCRGGDP